MTNKLINTISIISLLIAFSLLIYSCNKAEGNDLAVKEVYLNPQASLNERIENLISRMTIEEKVGQMCQYVGLEHMRAAEKEMSKQELEVSDARGFYPGLHSTDVAEMVEQGLIGSFLHVVNPAEAAYLQKLASGSRLGIPLLIGIDAVHGTGLVKGATIYPSPIGIAGTWDTSLARRVAEETAEEMRASGSHWTFAPNIDIARDPRWGRVGETFGEDPFLVSEMGRSMIIGFQGTDPATLKVAACAKHLIGGGESVNGLNGAPTDSSERSLREIHIPPYKAAVDEGVATIMTAHNELNGIPCHSDTWMMDEVLRNELGFEGFYISDWMDIERIATRHFTAINNDQAVFQTLEAGMDMHMHGPGFFESVMKLLDKGMITEERIDDSVRRILDVKFRLGLFDMKWTDDDQLNDIIFSDNHRLTSLEVARKSITLLKNDKEVLPLDPGFFPNIFVTGPNADNQSILGDWVNKQPEENVITVLEGIRNVFADSQIDYLDIGNNPLDVTSDDIEAARQRAARADVAILVVGENSFRWEWGRKTNGENSARSGVNLAGEQEELVRAVQSTGTPTIVVVVSGRPLALDWISKNIQGVIYAWEPGSFGGKAIAEVLAGEVNPSGKLPLTLPRSSGHILSVYNHKPTNYFHSYVIGETNPVYPFGYGLSYTEFSYSNLEVEGSLSGKKGLLRASVEVRNSGTMAGDEIVQLYIRDNISSVTRPVKELKGFKRITLGPGDSRRVIFDIDEDMLMYYDRKLNRILEPGWFTAYVGSSSDDGDLISVPFEIN